MRAFIASVLVFTLGGPLSASEPALPRTSKAGDGLLDALVAEVYFLNSPHSQGGQLKPRDITPLRPLNGGTYDYNDVTNKIFIANGRIDVGLDVFGVILDPTSVEAPDQLLGGTMPARVEQGKADAPWTLSFTVPNYGFGYLLRVETVPSPQAESTEVVFNLQPATAKDKLEPKGGKKTAKAKRKKCQVDITSPKDGAPFNPKAGPLVATGTVKELQEDGTVVGDLAQPVYGMLFDPNADGGKILPTFAKIVTHGPSWQMQFSSFPSTGRAWILRVRTLNGRGVKDLHVTVQ